MKMFKRLAAFGAAAILALSMGITAFAEGSPSTSGVVASTVTATDANGNSVKVNVGSQTEVKNEEARKILSTSAKDILVQTNDPNASEEGMKLVDLREVTVEGDVTFPLEITFTISGVTANSKVSVLHFDDKEKNAWESVPVKVNSDGTITATFNSLSPVAFLVNGAASNGAGTTSPKTGSSPVMMIAVLGAVVCAGGAFALSKKRA